LFARQGRVIYTNESARAFFNPLVTHRDLPEGLAEELDGAPENGRRSFFCYQLNGEPSWRMRTRPEYLDPAQPQRPACALLRLEEKLCRAVSHKEMREKTRMNALI